MRALTAVVAASIFMFASASRAAPSADRTAQQIDRLLAEELAWSPGSVAPRCDDATFLRRVWLDVVGDLPTPEHQAAFLLDPAPDKRERLVRELLDSPQYGQNWARYWRDVVLYRRIEDRAQLVSSPMVVQLTKELNDNKPWDKIATEFITATGDVRENGHTAVIFAQDGRTEETTAEMARIFLGIQIQCAQCHDHPWDRWKREQFHELAAFFPRIGVRPALSPTSRSFQVAANDRPQRPNAKMKDTEGRLGELEHFMPDLNAPDAPGTRMQPRFFLTSAELPYGVPDAQRRTTVAEWLTDSPWFATAVVNRMWAELLGEGFYEPVDDIGPDRTPRAAAAVELLSKRFVDSGYDLKWLVRTICATEAYQREVRPLPGPDEPPFAASAATPLRGDQLFSSLFTALELDETKMQQRMRGKAQKGKAYGGAALPRLMFNQEFGFDPSTDRAAVERGIPQALALMNSTRLNVGMMATPGSMLGRVLKETPQDADVIEELYLRVLCRQPSDAERLRALAYYDQVADRRKSSEDLLWALVNSAEFGHRR